MVKALATGMMDSKSADMISRRALNRLSRRTTRKERIRRITLHSVYAVGTIQHAESSTVSAALNHHKIY